MLALDLVVLSLQFFMILRIYFLSVAEARFVQNFDSKYAELYISFGNQKTKHDRREHNWVQFSCN